MKTSKFEEILRRKLESLKPDFQAQDWKKFQSFQQHAAPSFWQTYGHWLGYAVAVLTTVTVAVMYVNQSRQNDALLREMKGLREQVAKNGTGRAAYGVPPVLTPDATNRGRVPSSSTGGPPVPQPHDTVYVVQSRIVYRDRPVAVESGAEVLLSLEKSTDRQAVDNKINSTKRNVIQEKRSEDLSLSAIDQSSAIDESVSRPVIKNTDEKKETRPNADHERIAKTGETPSALESQNFRRLELSEVSHLPVPSLPAVNRNAASRRLLSRMPRAVVQPKPGVVAAVGEAKNPVLTREKSASENFASEIKTEKTPQAEEAEQVTKEESLLPKFGLNLPFRIGAGQQWEGRTKAFSLWNEVLLGEHWSVQTGLSWQKLEDQQFFSERLFKEKMRQEFRKDHAPKLPPNFDIFNITTHTRLVRIPLNLTYRNDLGNGLSYFFGAGTNLNLRARRTLSFDFKRPTNDYGQETKEQTVPFPLVSNANALVGVEKRWSPIVMQVSSFLNTRFKTFPLFDDRTDVGLQVKLLYEFKANKKK